MEQITSHRGRKTSEHNHKQQVREVAEMLLTFWPHWKIKAEMETKYGHKKRHVEEMIKKARVLLQDQNVDFDSVLKEHIARGENLIYEALQAGDTRSATTMFANMSRLRGLERSQVDVNHTGLEQPRIQIVLSSPTESKTIDITPEVKQISGSDLNRII